MLTNLYGKNDNFHPENSHVIPAMMRRFHEAKLRGDAEMVMWGAGTTMREFLHVDDIAKASVHILLLEEPIYKANPQPVLSHINAGTGLYCIIRELVETMQRVVGFEVVLAHRLSVEQHSPGLGDLDGLPKAHTSNTYGCPWPSCLTTRRCMKTQKHIFRNKQNYEQQRYE